MVMTGPVKAAGPMRWIVGLLLMGVFGRALVQDNPGKASRGVRIALECHTPIIVQRLCLPPMIQVLHLLGRYLENTEHLEKGVNP